MVTTKRKPTIYIQKIKRKESKDANHKKLSNHKGREQEMKETKELQNSQRTINKMAIPVNSNFTYK